MLLASFLASQFHAPWGCAFIRLQENGWKVGKEKRALLGEPSYETILHTLDSVSCRSVHSDWLLLE